MFDLNLIYSIISLILGTLYGLVIGIIPGAGATTGLVILFPIMPYFYDYPYIALIFIISTIASSTTGDSVTGVILGIPGANSAATTMIDGYPLAKQGYAARALTAGMTVSTINGILWGIIALYFLPLYSKLILFFGVPELWGFTILSFSSVVFISNGNKIKALISLCMGIFIGLIGTDPYNSEVRWTFNWDYLIDGVQLMPVITGLFAVPELLDGMKYGTLASHQKNIIHQIKQGLLDVWKNKILSFKGGIIGAWIGLLPGIGGSVSDWMAYSYTVASNPNEEFGNGNIKGIIGPEGANNAQKATSLIPTVLFGIPGASFAAIFIGLLSYIDFDMGSMTLLNDMKFFNVMTYSYILSTILVYIICILLMKFICSITTIPYKYYSPIIWIAISWSCMQYTGGIEDFLIFLFFGWMGIIMRYTKYSRASLMIGFILSSKIESLTIQLFSLYEFNNLIDRPIFVLLILCSLSSIIIGVKKFNRNLYV